MFFNTVPQNGMLYGHPMLAAFDIRFHERDAGSMAFFRFLNEPLHDIRCLVLCTRDVRLDSALSKPNLSGWTYHPEGNTMDMFAGCTALEDVQKSK